MKIIININSCTQQELMMIRNYNEVCEKFSFERVGRFQVNWKIYILSVLWKFILTSFHMLCQKRASQPLIKSWLWKHSNVWHLLYSQDQKWELRSSEGVDNHMLLPQVHKHLQKKLFLNRILLIEAMNSVIPSSLHPQATWISITFYQPLARCLIQFPKPISNSYWNYFYLWLPQQRYINPSPANNA